MKKKRRSLLCMFLCMMFALALAGCGRTAAPSQPAFEAKAQLPEQASGVVASSGAYLLRWDDTNKRVVLEDTARGVSWSSTPAEALKVRLDEFGLPVEAHPKVDSALYVEYIDPGNKNIVPVNSHNGAVKNGRVSCKKVAGGLKVTYYFDDVKIAVPVVYTIRASGLAVTVDPREIQEGKYKVYRVSVAPFFCSIANDGKDAYLFVPSGSGALIYPKIISSTGKTFSEQVYGRDPLIEERDLPETDEPVRLPVYGAKNGNRAVCAIIENGADSAYIEAVSGSQAMGYSAVYATFQLRSYADLRVTLFTGMVEDVKRYTDGMIRTKLSVGFYPLYGNEASYSGMAHTYSRYLTQTCGMPETEHKESALGVTIVGGVMTPKSFLGIPYNTLLPVTTLSQAQRIVEELRQKTGAALSVQLEGFGQTGLDPGKIAGGYAIGRPLGSLADLRRLSESCAQKGVSLFFDFDLVRLSKSGGGYSSLWDTAKAANNQTVYQYSYDIATRSQDKDRTRYALLSRSKLQGSAQELLDKTKKWAVPGFGFSTLSSIAYSDCASPRTYSKAAVSQDAASVLQAVRKRGRAVSVSGANAYAAACADTIFDSPMQSTENDMFDADVPFYQMVFKGHIPLATTPVNLAADPRDAVLGAIESGSAIEYSLMGSYDSLLTDAPEPVFFSGTFADLAPGIVRTISSLRGYYEEINGAKILRHSILANGVRQTVFDNGVTVYVNRTGKEQASPAGSLAAGGYLIVEADS